MTETARKEWAERVMRRNWEILAVASEFAGRMLAHFRIYNQFNEGLEPPQDLEPLVVKVGTCRLIERSLSSGCVAPKFRPHWWALLTEPDEFEVGQTIERLLAEKGLLDPIPHYSQATAQSQGAAR